MTSVKHEINAIAAATGMTCDKDTCCPDEVGQAPLSFPETEEEYYAFIEGGERELPIIEEKKYFGPHAAILNYSLAEELLRKSGDTIPIKLISKNEKAKIVDVRKRIWSLLLTCFFYF